MKRILITTIAIAFAIVFAKAQTLYAPNGTSGIGESTNNNIGIGTNSPNGKLDIKLGGWANMPSLLFDQEGDHPSIRLYRPTGIVNPYTTFPWWIENNKNLVFKSGKTAEIGKELVTTLVTFTPEGKVGIGTETPVGSLDINPGGWLNMPKISFNQTNDHPSIRLYRPTGNGNPYTAYPWWIENKKNLVFKTGSTAEIGKESVSSIVTFTTGGKVGIGIENPDVELAVNGTIHAQEIKVDMTGWSDFVFKNDYDLKSLDETEQFISRNGHLPDIPNEKEVEKDGINLGEMDAKLLQKIEELTLYLIEQNKRIEKIEKENEILKTKLDIVK
nr:hypothetical protein [uncultured Draconibacterium sp.]